MAKTKNTYICGQCGYETAKWLGRCPKCGEFNSFEEEVKRSPQPARVPSPASREMLPISALSPLPEERTKTNIEELDRVLSGGFVKGSLTLLGGEPGIGKSTLLLQMCRHISVKSPILYISGEESAAQIKLRADRLGVSSENLYILPETDMGIICSSIDSLRPGFVIADSIQTMQLADISSTPGSVPQIRESAQLFMRLAKGSGITVVIVGHVTKDGGLAGPRILEHMVDTVLYFEGERQVSYRMIRAVKNRFGATNEIGVFEMGEEGLTGIENPSEYMLSGRPLNVPGSVVTCAMEGTRPILAEVQALVSSSPFGMPRRASTGMDYNRIVMLLAMLEKRGGLQLGNCDCYINIAGGMKISEPALDLAAAAAIASSYRNKPLPPGTAVFGEVGLTGEARSVSGVEKRITEAAKLGFQECLVPLAVLRGLKTPKGMKALGVSNINEMFDYLFS